ncbi:MULTISPECIES: SCO family protein [Halomonas]|uniref:SCO family protein n=2 Tax=Halomonas TaxID=2745 RepID=A0A7X5AN86_9GAMM|nr:MULTISPECIES: SCO family protein [Halomonas]MDR5902519.1 SCO family protein [Halomonas icarae]NAW13413.1 SCO family protein [Halomonas icarae]TDB03278.1 SCO family protein [Halomonas marinisediminis]
MKRKGVWAGMVLIMLVAVGGVGWFQQQLTAGVDGGPVGGPVELASTRGEFSLEHLDDDQLAVLFFGYTHCPDVCPMSLAVVRQALAELEPAQRERLVPLMVSLDPERDSLARLEEYLAFFGERFVGATGSPVQLEELAERYGVVWRKVDAPDSAMGYTIDHSSSLYLVDREGNIQRRVLYSPSHRGLLAALHEIL